MASSNQQAMQLQQDLNQLIRQRDQLQKVIRKPSFTEEGGFVDKHLLSGQLPVVLGAAGGIGGSLLGAGAGGVGAIPGGLAGATLLGAGGASIENIARNLLGIRPQNSQQQLYNVGGGALTGLQSEMGGQVLGRVIPPVAGAVGKGLGWVGEKTGIVPAVRNVAQRIYPKLATSAFKQPLGEVVEAIKTGTPTIGQQAAERGISGSKEKVFNEVAKPALKYLINHLDDLLRTADDAGQLVDPMQVIKQLDPIKKKFAMQSNKMALKQIERKESEFIANWLDKTGIDEYGIGTLSPSVANAAKRLYQNKAKYGAELFETQEVTKEIAKALARGLRLEIERIVPKSALINKELHFFGELADVMANGLAKDLSEGVFKVANPITSGGLTAGAAFAGGPGTAAAVGAGTQLGRMFPAKTFLAAQLAKIANGKSTETIVPQMLAQPVFRKAIMSVLTRTLSSPKFLNNLGSKERQEQ